jgi:DNA repair photolyase
MLNEQNLVGENKHLFFNDDRLFINSALGCSSNCDYCYLDDIGLAKGKIIQKVDTDTIIQALEETKNILWSPRETVISFGCYSDPWSYSSRDSTIEIIQYLDKFNCRISLSTKQFVKTSHLQKLLLIENKNNLVFLISLPIITDIQAHEKGTCSAEERINSISNLKKLGFNAALYVKPFLQGITIKGVDIIESSMNDFQVPLILGRHFTADGEGKVSVVSNTIIFNETECEEYRFMYERLSKIGSICEHSYEVFNLIKGKKHETSVIA